MHRGTTYHSKLIASLLLAVMCCVHIIKIIHSHELHQHHQEWRQEKIFVENESHQACNICDYQLAKDALTTGDIHLQFYPVYFPSLFCRLLTSLNADHFLHVVSRGPPQA